MTQWESKLKTVKAIQALHSTDVNKIGQKIGLKLHNQLLYLTDLIVTTSEELEQVGARALIKINSLLAE